MIIILLMFAILLYYITNWKLFYWIGWFIVLCWLSILAFTVGTFISVYINLF